MLTEIEIFEWKDPPVRADLPDNRGWWRQERAKHGDIIRIDGPFKTRTEAERNSC